MRPDLLNPLFTDATALAGIGKRTADMIRRVVPFDTSGRQLRIADLLFILPHGLVDRRSRPGIARAGDGAIVTLELEIDRHQPPPPGRRNVPYRVFAHDETGEIALTFFHAQPQWLERSLPVAGRVIVSGRLERFNGRPAMVHPDHVLPAAEAASLPALEPVYPLTAGLSGRVLRRAVGQALERIPPLPEWLDAALKRREGFPSFAEALQVLHHPDDLAILEPACPARRRLAFDELLSGQIALAMVRARMRRHRGRSLAGDNRLRERIRANLPYQLTASQHQALEEIGADLASGERMLRLLQGDVGSGKTVVALLAMAQAVEAGTQAALLAPTEVLARQHHGAIATLLEPAGLRVALLTGREKGRSRTAILAGLADGSIAFAIGTHALIQEDVRFHDLGLAVIDEQHRFGVHQRLSLSAKGAAPDMLVMTATPIPRTLVMTAYGDMEVSQLREKPAGRKPVTTVTLPMERTDELIARLGALLAKGQKAYWICPLVEESDEIDLTAAEDRFEQLRRAFGNRVGLVHGRMKGAEKDAAMADFQHGETQLLVATTVIEVGIDVPDATIMVIEHAERFGLAQLHQLRGRVGRGKLESHCVLLYKSPLGAIARQRLEILRSTEDGFLIAEEDLKLRGEGELLGTRQSGSPGFRIAQIEHHADLLAMARDDARLILHRDPELVSDRGRALRLLLYLFGRDNAIRLLRAG